jgi:hypothetical protein
VYTTVHLATAIGACSLPAGDYAVGNAVALGTIDSLRELKFNANFCGHVLRINCGHGDVDIIVIDLNLGGGLDLYGSTWNKVTNNAQPGVFYCHVELTGLNMFKSSEPVCYYSTGETDNAWYRSVGLLNTAGRRVVSAVLDNGVVGQPDRSSPYFAFHGKSNADQRVSFAFDDGSSYQVAFSDCRDGSQKQYWS